MVKIIIKYELVKYNWNNCKGTLNINFITTYFFFMFNNNITQKKAHLHD